MKLLLVTIALLFSTSLLACSDNKCEEYFSYEFRSEVGVYDFYEVDICFKGMDVNQDNDFTITDLFWMANRVVYQTDIPDKEDQIGDFNGDGMVTNSDFCKMYKKAFNEGIVLAEACPAK